VLEDRCTHRGGPLHEGDVEGQSIVCPWHGSTFDLRTGRVVRGPASVGQPAYESRVQDGRLQIRRHEEGALRRNAVSAEDLRDR
jgi:nitrite reductase/ring-hydroxylating ferredoxin subunit